jgi:hypothetical protein
VDCLTFVWNYANDSFQLCLRAASLWYRRTETTRSKLLSSDRLAFLPHHWLCERVTKTTRSNFVFGPLRFVIEARTRLAPSFVFGTLGSSYQVTETSRPKLFLRKAWLCYRVPKKDSLQALPSHRFAFYKEHTNDSPQALSSPLFPLVIASRKATRSTVCLWAAWWSRNGLASSLVVGARSFVIESRKQFAPSLSSDRLVFSLDSRPGRTT